MENLLQRYGRTALVAGASEGLGAAFASHLAAEGMNLVLVARRKEPLEIFAAELKGRFKIEVDCISMDLAVIEAAENLFKSLVGREINLVVYNAALSHIGPFEQQPLSEYAQMAQVNMIAPMQIFNVFGREMLQRGKGACIMMASLAGFQGSGFLSVYAASKAFDRVLAESLWYEWKNRGVDVIACCAGATATPNFIRTKPAKQNWLAPKVQRPEAVVEECFLKLGKTGSFVSGRGNKVASFFMQKILPRNIAIKIMGDTTRKMYRF